MTLSEIMTRDVVVIGPMILCRLEPRKCAIGI